MTFVYLIVTGEEFGVREELVEEVFGLPGDLLELVEGLQLFRTSRTYCMWQGIFSRNLENE